MQQVGGQKPDLGVRKLEGRKKADVAGEMTDVGVERERQSVMQSRVASSQCLSSDVLLLIFLYHFA